MTHFLHLKHPLHPFRQMSRHQKSILGAGIFLVLLNVIIFMLACQVLVMLLQP